MHLSSFLKRFLPLVAVAVVGAALSLPGSPSGEAPAQPIEFSHRVHAGENRIPCSYCHTGAARAASAGVPSVATCYECHRGVKLRNPEIAKVFAYWESKRPIRWVRVHSLPEHVYFSHKRHTLGGADCQQCHGQVESMERAAQVSDLTMAWCVNCHQQRSAPLECSTCHK